MENIVTSTTNPDINEIVRLYAKEKGISDPAAWAAVRNTFVPKSEVLNIIADSQNRAQGQGQGQPQSNRIVELMSQKQDASIEKLKLDYEIRKLEMQERIETREQRKLEIEEKKLIQDKEIQMRKLELEEKRQQSKDELETRRQQSKEEFDQKVILLQTSGKKPDETLEIVKKQGEFYERLLDEKADHMGEVAKLKVEIEAAANKGDTSAQSFIKQMDEYNKMQETVVKSSLGILKARGFSEEQLDAVKQTLEKKEDNTVSKLWEVGKQIWKQVEPQIQIQPSPNAAPALIMQSQAAEQQRLAMEREEKLRKQIEEEARRLTVENATLEQEKTRLKQNEETNRALQQQYYEQREILVRKATDIGIPVTDQMNNEQIFTAIEKRDAEIEREHQVAAQQAREREKQEQAAAEIVETVEKTEPVKLEKPKDITPDEIDVPEKETPGRKKKKIKGGNKLKYTIYREDGTELARVESNNHKNAGLKIANTLNGTPENPVRIKVSDESGEQKEYDAYSAQVENNAGTKYAVPRVKAVSA